MKCRVYGKYFCSTSVDLSVDLCQWICLCLYPYVYLPLALSFSPSLHNSLSLSRCLYLARSLSRSRSLSLSLALSLSLSLELELELVLTTFFCSSSPTLCLPVLPSALSRSVSYLGLSDLSVICLVLSNPIVVVLFLLCFLHHVLSDLSSHLSHVKLSYLAWYCLTLRHVVLSYHPKLPYITLPYLPSLSVSLSLSFFRSLSLSLCLSFFLPLSLSVFLSIFRALAIYVPVFPYFCLSVCLSFC